MKTLSGTVKLATLGAVGLGSILTIVVFAQGVPGKKAATDAVPQKIRLILGCETNEPVHVTEDSLNGALSNCDKKNYKVHYYRNGVEDRKQWPKGDLTDICCTGAVVSKRTKGDVNMFQPSGSHSTIQVNFVSEKALKTFVDTLVYQP